MKISCEELSNEFKTLESSIYCESADKEKEYISSYAHAVDFFWVSMRIENGKVRTNASCQEFIVVANEILKEEI